MNTNSSITGEIYAVLFSITDQEQLTGCCVSRIPLLLPQSHCAYSDFLIRFKNLTKTVSGMWSESDFTSSSSKYVSNSMASVSFCIYRDFLIRFKNLMAYDPYVADRPYHQYDLFFNADFFRRSGHPFLLANNCFCLFLCVNLFVFACQTFGHRIIATPSSNVPIHKS